MRVIIGLFGLGSVALSLFTAKHNWSICPGTDATSLYNLTAEAVERYPFTYIFINARPP